MDGLKGINLMPKTKQKHVNPMKHLNEFSNQNIIGIFKREL